jgi:hypothetical protein
MFYRLATIKHLKPGKSVLYDRFQDSICETICYEVTEISKKIKETILPLAEMQTLTEHIRRQRL